MAKPVIGIGTDVTHIGQFDQLRLNLQYVDAVERAGGVPILLAATGKSELVAQQLDRVDAVIGIGGDDYHSNLYGCERHYSEKLLPQRRQDYDLVFLSHVWQRKIPALMICASAQGLNIIQGGGLIQHLDDLVEQHQYNHGLDLAHIVDIETETLLHYILNQTEIEVNSFHHQAVDNLGSGLRVSARAPDGTVEAIEPIAFAEHPLLAVQWHPERIPDQPHSKQIFGWLIDQAVIARPFTATAVKTSSLSPFV
ncbi:MAG: gamma-glutamyl-gamma-aminobutyrate hydrolase family protein [Candidatus Uhrbacteria bacterium]